MAGSTAKKRLSVAASSDDEHPQQQPDGGRVGARAPYESPLKRVRRALERDADKRVFEMVSDLKDFVAAEDKKGRGDPLPATVAASITIRMRLVWTSFETCATGAVARLHLVDKCTDGSVDELHEVFKAHYPTKKNIIDPEMVTVSLYGVDNGTAGIPADGTIISVLRMWSLKLFSKQSCQLSTSLDYIKVDE